MQSSSWAPLTSSGGVPFVTRLAELYFLMKINVAHVQLAEMQKGSPFAWFMAEDALSTALAACGKRYWMPGFRWRPADTPKAKFRFSFAVFLRLRGDPGDVEDALRNIEIAGRLLPDDEVVKREREAIEAWEASLM